MFFTRPQEKTLIIVAKITSVISIISSLFIIIDVLRSSKKLASSYHRIIFGMSVCLILAFAWNLVDFWFMPSENENNGNINIPLCMMRRFFVIFDISVVMYNVTLSIYYFLVVKCNWSRARVCKLEPWLHIFPIGWGVMIATIAVILAEVDGEFELGFCFGHSRVGGYVYVIPIWIAITAVTVLNLIVYWTVRKQETRNERYHSFCQDEERPRRKLSRQAAIQGVLYVFPFYITWIPWTICFFSIFYGNLTPNGVFAAWLCMVITGPLQGFFNLLVYIAPRYLKYRKDRPESSFLQVIGQTLRRTLCFRNVHQDSDDQHSSESDDKSEDGSHIEHGGRRTLASATNSTEPLLVQVDD